MPITKQDEEYLYWKQNVILSAQSLKDSMK